MAFPDINKHVTNVTVEEEFATIRSSFEGGYVQTREKHSRLRRKITATYFISTADKDLLVAHYKDVRGSVSFQWEHPDLSEVYTVRYSKPLSVPSKGGEFGWFEITINLEEL